MRFKEFGNIDRDTVMLLHGGGLNWWNYREAARLLESGYHVILPILDGHAGSDRPFDSIESNASELIAFIDERFGGSVRFIGGLSLGAQILLEMLSQRSGVCRHALVESAAVVPSRLTNALIGPSVGCSYGLIKNRAFAKLQFRSLHMRPELFEDYYRDTCLISKRDMISFLKANTAYSLKPEVGSCTASVHVYAGSRETGEILRSVKKIKAALPDCGVNVLEGLYHGGFSLGHPEKYAKTVASIIESGRLHEA